MDEATLIPNKSIGIFHIKDRISNYTYLPHTKQHNKEKDFSYDSYEFDGIEMTLWVEHGIIVSIACSKFCFWEGENLILMPYEQFLCKYNVKPCASENVYLLVNGRGQNQTIYDFDDLGLQIWVWRGKIRTIIVTNYNEII